MSYETLLTAARTAGHSTASDIAAWASALVEVVGKAAGADVRSDYIVMAVNDDMAQGMVADVVNAAAALPDSQDATLMTRRTVARIVNRTFEAGVDINFGSPAVVDLMARLVSTQLMTLVQVERLARNGTRQISRWEQYGVAPLDEAMLAAAMESEHG